MKSQLDSSKTCQAVQFRYHSKCISWYSINSIKFLFPPLMYVISLHITPHCQPDHCMSNYSQWVRVFLYSRNSLRCSHSVLKIYQKSKMATTSYLDIFYSLFYRKMISINKICVAFPCKNLILNMVAMSGPCESVSNKTKHHKKQYLNCKYFF